MRQGVYVARDACNCAITIPVLLGIIIHSFHLFSITFQKQREANKKKERSEEWKENKRHRDKINQRNRRARLSKHKMNHFSIPVRITFPG